MKDQNRVESFNKEAARFTAEQAAHSQQRLESWYRMRDEAAGTEGWALRWDGFALVEMEISGNDPSCP